MLYFLRFLEYKLYFFYKRFFKVKIDFTVHICININHVQIPAINSDVDIHRNGFFFNVYLFYYYYLPFTFK